MGLLKDKDRAELRKELERLAGDVTLLVFTQDTECQYCSLTREIVEEITAASSKVTSEIKDFVADGALAREYRIDRIPAIAILGERDHGIRFYGVPSGYEFAALVDTVLDVGDANDALPEAAAGALARLSGPMHLQVFVSPT